MCSLKQQPLFLFFCKSSWNDTIRVNMDNHETTLFVFIWIIMKRHYWRSYGWSCEPSSCFCCWSVCHRRCTQTASPRYACARGSLGAADAWISSHKAHRRVCAYSRLGHITDLKYRIKSINKYFLFRKFSPQDHMKQYFSNASKTTT